MEKTPQFVVTDRRKFTSEGELRDGVASSLDDVNPPAAAAPGSSIAEPVEAAAPAAQAVEPLLTNDEASEFEEALGPEPTAAEAAEQRAAYQQSSNNVEDMIRQANPGAPPSVEMDFEQLVQSIYLSAIVAMGAGVEPGQKPRVDIVGARQSIDMLDVLGKKTKGNLTDQEQRLLQNALFNLRMMFLEITKAITSSAQQPPVGGPPRGPRK